MKMRLVRRTAARVLGAGAIHVVLGSVHGDVLLGSEYLLGANRPRNPGGHRRARDATDQLLSMGAFLPSHRSIPLLYSLSHVATHER